VRAWPLTPGRRDIRNPEALTCRGEAGIAELAVGEVDEEMKMTEGNTNGNFFAVDINHFAKVCEAGSDAAATYLVLARGSSRDNCHTHWSVNAVEKYLGLSRGRSKDAIQQLCAHGLVQQVSEGWRPVYAVFADAFAPDANAPSWAWLPNTLIDGVAGEPSPVERLRQTQDPLNLRLFVKLYHSQHLVEHGGIDPKLLRQEFTRLRVGQHAEYVVWGFRPEDIWVSDAFWPCYGIAVTEAMTKNWNKANLDVFHSRLQVIVSLGLAAWTPFLMESGLPGAQPIHAVVPVGSRVGTPLEQALGDWAQRAGQAIVTESQWAFAYERSLQVVPVLAHMAQVQLVGVLRMHYRPRTRLTSAWFADLHEQGGRYLQQYQALAGQPGGNEVVMGA
jgi:hypothetical protein